MRFTISEESIIKCICQASGPVTYSHLINHTKMDFLNIDKNLKKMIADGRIEIDADGGFVVTKQTKKNPFVRLILQEIYEEKLAVDKSQYSTRQYTLVQRLFNLISWRSK